MRLRDTKIKRLFQRQEGFSLLEVLLVVGISSVILLGALRLADDWAKELGDTKEVSYLVNIMNAAESYVAANFEYIWADAFLMNENFTNNDANPEINDGDLLNPPNRVLRLAIDNINVAAGTQFDFYLKSARGSLATGFPARSPLGLEPQIFVRNMGYVDQKPTLEVFVLTQKTAAPLIPYKRISNIARFIGPEAGIISRVDTENNTIFTGNLCGAGHIMQSIFGTWEIPANAFMPPFAINADNQYCPTLQPDPTEPRGANIAMRRVVQYDFGIVDGVLYTVPIPNRPEANVMQANLNMTGQDLLNVGVLHADQMQVQNRMQVTGQGSTVFFEDAVNFAGNSFVFAEPDENSTCNDWDHTTLNPDKILSDTGCQMRGGDVILTDNTGLDVQDITGDINSRLAVSGSVINADVVGIGASATLEANAVVGFALNVVNEAFLPEMIVDTMNVNGTLSGEGGRLFSSILTVNSELNTPFVVTPLITTDRIESASAINIQQSTGNPDTTGNIQLNQDLRILQDLDANQINIQDLVRCTADYEIRNGTPTPTTPYDCRP